MCYNKYIKGKEIKTMKKLSYEIGTKKTCSYAEALEYAKSLGEVVKTLFEEVEEPV